MNASRACPQCLQPLAQDAPDGLCPGCLLKVAMGSHPEALGTVVLPDAQSHLRSPPIAGGQFGRYRIIRELGRGGMGAVYEAEQLESGRRVALKVLTHQLDSPEARARFLREGRLAASINHPNSVYVFGTEEIDGTPAIAMELVAGGTLQERVERHGPLPPNEAVDIILQVIAGLEAAEAFGILHRDIKPANCFEDVDGTIKIGDFGLSISTVARADTNLTVQGAFLGTPAFCSPEQLRGDELNVRSDIYAVGVTLFYLLTGRTPFAGRNVVQLLANAIEQAPVSPRKLRREISQELAGIVLRCLRKQPAERFQSYASLSQALRPFSSDGPAPATLALRFLAGVVDLTLMSAITMSLSMGAWGGVTSMLEAGAFGSSKFVILMLGSFALWILYYAIAEGRWGASIGKAICRLRIIGHDRNAPGIPRAALRALIFLILPVLPYWIVFAIDPRAILNMGSDLVRFGGSFGYYIILIVLFSTARRRNGFAGLHDLVSRTRVIRRPVRQVRPALTEKEEEQAAAETAPRVGPYHVIAPLGQTPEWLLGYDTRLLRKVWLHTVPPGTPPVLQQLRSVGRIGRLRWISGRRSDEENWDAFEGITGKPLMALLDRPQPWGAVRFWLLDLATELKAAERDATLPAVLALDRVWITGEGRAKLLDFRAPTLPPGVPSPVHATAPIDLLAQVAHTALGGQVVSLKGDAPPSAPMPLHARSFLNGLSSIGSLTEVVAALGSLMHRVVSVSRARRAVLVAGCVVFPLFAAGGAIFGLRMVDTWQRTQPDVAEMAQLLSARGIQRSPWVPPQKRISDDAFSTYIAAHYRDTISDSNKWNSLFALSMIQGEKRQFAEQAVKTNAQLSDDDVLKADAAVKPYLDKTRLPQFTRQSWLPLFLVATTLVIYVAIPALAAALLFRGGLVLLAAGVAIVRKDGTTASRFRVFWRSVITWAPTIAALILGISTAPAIGAWAAVALAAPVVIFPVLLSISLPERGIQDRLAGTTLVPR